jgi:hypothetical protein
MTQLRANEEVYASALKKLFTDPATIKSLEADPEGTMEKLGFDLDDKARSIIRASDQPELGVAAVPAVLVRVATNGTRPAVSVAVSTSTFAATRGKAEELEKK